MQATQTPADHGWRQVSATHLVLSVSRFPPVSPRLSHHHVCSKPSQGYSSHHRQVSPTAVWQTTAPPSHLLLVPPIRQNLNVIYVMQSRRLEIPLLLLSSTAVSLSRLSCHLSGRRHTCSFEFPRLLRLRGFPIDAVRSPLPARRVRS